MYVRPRPRFRPRNAGTGFRPSLALDFTSGTLNSAITFSRGTQATQYTSNGTLQYAPNNLLTYSNQADNAAWTKSNLFVQTNLLLQSEDISSGSWIKQNLTVTANSIVAPDGNSTADTITAPGGVVSLIAQSVGTTVASSPYTQSIYAKAGTKTVIQADFNAAGWGSDLRANFDLANGVLGTVDAGITATITPLSNGWYRCTASRTKTPTAGNLIWCVVDSATSVREEICTAGSMYLWGAQLVQGSVPGDYVATTSAALPVLYADYQGNLRARKLCENTAAAYHAIFETITPANYMASFYAKAGERTFVQLAGGVSGNDYVTFNLSTGVISQQGSGITNAFITPLANGWYRVGGAMLSSGSGPFIVVCQTGTGGWLPALAGDGSSGIYIADAQLEAGSVVQAYNDTTSTAYYGPRFDYDPVTLAAKGLLIEEQRANLLTYSDGTIANLTSSNNVTNATSTLNPSFTNSIQFGDNTLQRIAYKVVTTTAAAAYTLSVFVRMDDNSTPVVGTTITSGDFGLVFEGHLVSVASTVTAFGNSTHRVQVTVTAAGGTGLNVGVIKYTGQSAKGFRITGFQLEAGAFATSYIPTSASQVTRAADVASVNTLSPWFNAVAGTLYVESIANAASPANQYLATLNDGTTNNRVTLFKATGGTANSRVTAAGVASNPTAPATTIAGITSKVALTFSTAASGVNIYVNGTAGTAVTAAATPAGILRLGLGLDETASTSFLNGHLRRITFYPRQMTSGEGTALTTL